MRLPSGFVRTQGPCLAFGADPARRRASGRGASPARVRLAWRRSQGDRPIGARRREGEPPDDDRRHRYGRGARADGGDRRYRTLPRPREAGRLSRAEPECAAIRTGNGLPRADHQAKGADTRAACWSRPARPRHAPRARCAASFCGCTPDADSTSLPSRRRANSPP